jgi:tetratricopeptide (TPR) repeat protein
MHWQQTEFVRSIRGLLPEYFEGASVLEFGSYDVNGSIRPLFSPRKYIGIDLVDGPGVDVVISADQFKSPERFDVCISCECFEHNPVFLEAFRNMIEHACAGGLVIFTCASEGRPEHGTSRTTPEDSPGTVKHGWEYYRNLTEADFAAVDLDGAFTCHRFFRISASHDLYFVGFKRDAKPGRDRVLAELEEICRQIESASAAIRSAAELLNANRAPDAAASVREAVRAAAPGIRPHVAFECIALWIGRQDWEAAELVSRDALGNCESAALHWQRSHILHHLGQSVAALDEAQKAHDQNPANETFAFHLGALLLALNNDERAEHVLSRLTDSREFQAPAYRHLGQLYRRQERWRAAVMAARKAAECAPGDAEIKQWCDELLLAAPTQAGAADTSKREPVAAAEPDRSHEEVPAMWREPTAVPSAERTGQHGESKPGWRSFLTGIAGTLARTSGRGSPAANPVFSANLIPHIRAVFPVLAAQLSKPDCDAKLAEEIKRLIGTYVMCWPFDEEHYLQAYPNVAVGVRDGHFKSGRDHFRRIGYLEARLPIKAEVDPDWYLNAYPDTANAVKQGLVKSLQEHFTRSGYREGRLPWRPAIDAAWYSSNYLGHADATPEACEKHFVSRGYRQGAIPMPVPEIST